MTNQERESIATAIAMYQKSGTLNRLTFVDNFLSRIPCVTTRRLQSLIKSHGAEIAIMAGAKSVEYRTGEYAPSGRGAFGREKGGDRAKRVKPSIHFIF